MKPGKLHTALGDHTTQTVHNQSKDGILVARGSSDTNKKNPNIYV